MVMQKIDYSVQFANPPELDLESGGGEKLVEAAGYISAEEQILSMLQAGVRLDESRKELYDVEGDLDDNFAFDSVGFDPTRMPGFDPADASAIGRVVDQRLKDQAKKAKEAKEAEVAVKAEQSQVKE